ncbi:MAG: hypothetical protein IJY28_01625 [Clostridia bacterium]|nr:hypothetical protein [Clostridia bacterium]
MKRTNKLLAMTALLLLLVMLLTGCTPTDMSICPPSGYLPEDQNLSERGTEPIWIGEGTPQITIMMQRPANVSDWAQDAYTQKLEKDGNVEIVYEWIPDAEPDAYVRMRLLSGENVPMVVNYELNLTTGSEAGKYHIVNIAPYITQAEAWYTVENDTNYPDHWLLAQITTAEGDIFGLPKYIKNADAEVPYKMWVNADWLQQLGMTVEDIKTIPDFHQMLRRFKNEDANGNGDLNDEIPYMPMNGCGGTAYKFLTNAFVYEGDDTMLLVQKTGERGRPYEVTASYLQDEWYDAAAFIRQLVSDELLPEDGFTQNENAMRTLLAESAAKNGGKSVVGVSTGARPDFFNAGDGYDFRSQYVSIAPLTAGCYEGQTAGTAPYFYTKSKAVWHVTTAAGIYEGLCVRLGDVQQRADYYLLSQHGAEKINWLRSTDYLQQLPDWEQLKAEAAGNGIALNPSDVKLTGAYAGLDMAGEYVWYDPPYADVTGLTWADCAPTVSGWIEFQQALPEHTLSLDGGVDAKVRSATVVQQKLMRLNDVVLPPISLTTDEKDEIGTTLEDLAVFVRKERVLYYCGQDCILSKGKEDFTESLKELGLDKALKVYNYAYFRQHG